MSTTQKKIQQWKFSDEKWILSLNFIEKCRKFTKKKDLKKLGRYDWLNLRNHVQWAGISMAYQEYMWDWRDMSWVRNCIWLDIFGKSVEKRQKENLVIMIDASDKWEANIFVGFKFERDFFMFRAATFSSLLKGISYRWLSMPRENQVKIDYFDVGKFSKLQSNVLLCSDGK